jgi:hypothetical protein
MTVYTLVIIINMIFIYYPLLTTPISSLIRKRVAKNYQFISIDLFLNLILRTNFCIQKNLT